MSGLKHRIIQYLDGQDPEVVLEQLRDVGSRRAKLSAIVQTLDHRRKGLLSELQAARRAEGDKVTEALLVEYAHAHPEYKEFLTVMQATIGSHAEADAEFWLLRSKLDYLMRCLDFAKAEAYVLRQ